MSIYKRGDRWQVLVDADRGADGKRRRVSVGSYRTKREAESAERDALQRRERGIDLEPKTITVAEVVDRFVQSRKNDERAARTTERYAEIARLQINPHLGQIRVAKVTKAHIAAWLATLKEQGSAKGKPLSAQTRKHACTLLSSALRWAMDNELADRNVAARSAPRVESSSARALTDDEMARFFAEAERTRWGPFFRLALATGARRGELVALKWTSIDFDGATVTLSRAAVEVGKGSARRVLEKGTKTNRTRVVPLSPMALEALRRQRALQAQHRLTLGPAYADSGHVFQRVVGGSVAPDDATKAFQAIRNRLGIAASLHSLRHTAATWMFAEGNDAVTTARVLGHTRPSTTLNIYGHVVEGAEAKAVASIERRLRKEA